MILVTGATGNVGTELVPRLLAKGEAVRVLTRRRANAAALGAVDVVEGDLGDRAAVQAAVRGVRAVYLIAFELEQVSNVVAAARAARVEQVVRQSTIEAGAQPPMGPGRWHREQEQVVEQSGLAWTHLRPTMMMSNTAQWWSESIRTAGKVFFPGGAGGVSPVHPADVAAAAAEVLTRPGHGGKAYDVTGPEVLTIGAMVATIARAIGRPLEYVDIEEQAAASWMKQQGLPDFVADALVETLRALRAGRFAYVADLAHTLTGQPSHTFAQWAQAHAAAFGATGRAS